tara:strand:- start:1791 stop:2030 length:240 start_codon:yes stop_codon:yes gene_type:complete
MYGKKSPAKKRSCYKMKGKSPMMKALIGNQHRLPEDLKAKIIASPAKKKKPCPGCSTICPSCRTGKSPARNYKKGYYKK